MWGTVLTLIIATCSIYPIQGISYETVEDNLFNWKCSIKGAVRCSPRVTVGSEPRAVGQSVQGRHILL